MNYEYNKNSYQNEKKILEKFLKQSFQKSPKMSELFFWWNVGPI